MPNGQGYFFQQNRLGSVTHLTNFVGNPIEKYRYDAFGTPTTLDPILGYFNNRFRFTGREYQEAFGIYEYRNRAYHPGLGRFLSEDPLGFGAGDTNMFRYCGGDPVNRSDPSGLLWGEIPGVAGGIGGLTTGAIGGFTFGVGNQIYSYAAGNGFSWSQVGFDTGVGAGAGFGAGLLVGTFVSVDPSAITEATLTDAALVGLIAAAITNHLRPPSPPQAQPPPPPPAPPPSSTPSDPPPVYQDPNGTRYDPNGTALPGGEENSVPAGIGSITPFAFPGYSVVPVENESDFGKGGMILINNQVVRVYSE